MRVDDAERPPATTLYDPPEHLVAGPVRYAGILSDAEKQLHQRLESLLHDVSPAEKETLAFAEVKALMARLGLRSP